MVRECHSPGCSPRRSDVHCSGAHGAPQGCPRYRSALCGLDPRHALPLVRAFIGVSGRRSGGMGRRSLRDRTERRRPDPSPTMARWGTRPDRESPARHIHRHQRPPHRRLRGALTLNRRWLDDVYVESVHLQPWIVEQLPRQFCVRR